MSQKIRVDLEFNANTQKAKAQMKELQESLTNIINTTNQPGNMAITPGIQQAQQAAMGLKIALENATNVDTGKLNLHKFQSELKQSGMSLRDYANQLSKLGPAGVDAFTKTARAIANADTKLFQLSGSMKRLSDTLFSNIRWQLAGGAINMVTQAISGAVDYAKQLDKSLTNIQIVTGKSSSSMAKFAKEANQAAKALGTTTKAYADASLIYFQQGLSGSAVKERTETTIKLANVTGQSAEKVSDYMTAIWNNFDDGSQSLEYYADVITKLGAATASSTDEIAQGLEKFAAVADTVGLSYEYATSALATVTAETRQSADVVGTAFKTIFARMESLKLGENLDDGTTLGQYSTALATIGVNIKDASGELKDMDTILEETGNRWTTLSKDQQVALAQSVAGVRQYTQFIALMDNWDVMQSNLEMANEATGTLNEQQAIYSGSVEAMQNKMKASGEGLKESFLDADTLKDVYSGLSKILDVVKFLTETFGGLKGILLLAASALTSIYSSNISNFFDGLITKVSLLGTQVKNLGIDFVNTFRRADNQIEKTQIADPRMTAMQEAANMAANSPGGITRSELLKEELQTQMMILDNEDNLTAAQKQQLNWQMELLQQRSEELNNAARQLEMEQKITEEQGRRARQAGASTDAVSQVARTVGSVEQASIDLTTGFGSVQNGEIDTSDEQVRKEMSESAMGEVDQIKQDLESLGVDTAQMDIFGEVELQLEDFVKNGSSNIDLLMEKLRQLGDVATGAAQGRLNDVTGLGDQVTMTDKQEQTMDSTVAAISAAADGTTGASVGTDLRSTINNLGHMGNSSETGGIGFNEDGTAMDSRIESLRAEGEALQQSREALKSKLSTLKEGTAEYEACKKALDDNTASIGKYQKKAKGTVTQISKERKARKQNTNLTKDGRKELDKFTQSEIKNGKVEKKNNTERKKITKGFKKMREEVKKGGKEFKSYGTYLSQGLSGATKLASGFLQLTNSLENLSNKIATGKASWKDYLSAAMGLMMALPQIIGGAKQLGTAFGAITEKLFAKKTATEADTKSLEQNTLKEKENTAAEQQAITTSEAEVIAEEAEQQAEQESTMTTQQHTATVNADVIAENADAMNAPAVVAAEEQEAKAKRKGIGATLASTGANLAKLFSKGPPGWVMGAISTALVAVPLVAVGLSAIKSGSASGGQEKAIEDADAAIETADTNLDAINENQELSASISDLTQEFKDLKESGGDTMDVFEDMLEQVPKLIENYQKLGETLGQDIDTTGYEQAFETFKLTGDTGALEQGQADLDYRVMQAKYGNASSKFGAATTKMIQQARDSESGSLSGDVFTINMGDGAWDHKGVTSALKDYDFASGQLKINMSDPHEVMSAYEDMKTALAKLQADPNVEEDDAAIVALQDNLKLMEEAANQAREALDELYSVAEVGFNDLNQASLIKSGKTISGEDASWDALNTLTDYENARKDILKELMQAYDITEEQAEKLLSTSEEFGQYERALNALEEGGGLDLALKRNGWKDGGANEQFREWWDSLSEEDKTLALSLDYTGLTTVEQLNEALAEQHDLMLQNQALQEVMNLGVAEEDFQTYTDILVDCNEYLDENNAVTKQVAAAQIGLNKGLSSLKESWDDIAKVLSKAERNTLDYAEAIGSIKKAMEQAFGYKPSTSFVESHLEEIQELINGNVEGFEELQKLMAEDAVKNITFSTKDINQDYAVIESDIQNALNALINDLDTSIEVGQGTTLSGEYLNTLQQALRSGQMTMDQLNSIMSTAGFELEITDWEEVPGPIKTITTWSKDNPDEKKTTYTQEMIQVPIINGIDNVSGSSAPSVNAVRSVDETSISSMSTKADEGGEQEKKKLEDEIERYHEIERELSSLERAYSRIGRAKDQAFGGKKLALIRQENELIHEQIDALEREKAEAENYYTQDRAALDKYGVSFGANGEITNYDEVYAAQIEQYNTNPEAYEEAYTEFTEAMARYEETLDKVEELKDQLDEKRIEEFNNRMEAVTYEVELNVSLNEDSMALIEFQLEGLTDSAADAAKKLALMGKQMENTISDAETYKKGISDLLGLSDIDMEALADPGYLDSIIAETELTEEQVSQLREYRDGLMESVSAMREYRDSISDTLIAAFEDANAEMEKFSTELEHSIAMVEGYRNILDLAGRDALGLNDELFNTMAKTSYEIANNSVSVAKSKMEQDMASLQAIEEAMADARQRGDEAGLKELEEAYDEIYAVVQEDQQNLLDATADALERATALFEEEMNSIMRTFENVMSGQYGNYDQLEQSLERQKKLEDLYLDDYKKIYELSKLHRNVIKSIDETDSVIAKTKLRDIQQEINELQESGAQVTQYEVNALKAKYDLRLAEIALEEAQNAKSRVRMQRDSEGNWGYVYTANQDNIAKAQQAYEDKLYAYQNLTQQRTDELISQMQSIPREYAEAVQAIYEDQTLNDEERALAIAEVQQYYADMYNHVVEQMDVVTGHAAQLYTEDWKKYADTTGYKISQNDQWIDSFNETTYAQKMGYATLEQAQDQFLQSSDTMLTSLSGAYATYRTNVKTTLDTSIDDLDAFLGTDGTDGTLAGYMEQIRQQSERVAVKAEETAERNADSFEKTVDEASTWLSQYSGIVDEWVSETEAIADGINDLISSYASLEGSLYDVAAGYDEITRAATAAMQATGTEIHNVSNNTQDTTTTNRSAYYDGSGKSDEDQTVSAWAAFSKEKLDSDPHTGVKNKGQIFVFSKGGFAFTSSRETFKNKKMLVNLSTKLNTEQGTAVKVEAGMPSGISSEYEYIPLRQLVTDKDANKVPAFSFDTGGYTGSWDSSGRMAMLHQKELVLNAHDTENFLAGIDILRDIVQTIDLQTLVHQNSLKSMLSVGRVPMGDAGLEQHITIHAEFPAARERTEIEAAFDSLLNRASQFANRKK